MKGWGEVKGGGPSSDLVAQNPKHRMGLIRLIEGNKRVSAS